MGLIVTTEWVKFVRALTGMMPEPPQASRGLMQKALRVQNPRVLAVTDRAVHGRCWIASQERWQALRDYLEDGLAPDA